MQDQAAAQRQEQTDKTKRQPSRGDVRKRCSKNMLQTYKRAPMAKCDFTGDFMVWVFSSKFDVTHEAFI